MSKICVTCGLPEELCVCEAIAKESQKITVSIVKKKFGKEYTQIEGINESDIDIKELAKRLKQKFACGGTAKDGKIELQGSHRKTIGDALIAEGFAPDTIEVKN